MSKVFHSADTVSLKYIFVMTRGRMNSLSGSTFFFILILQPLFSHCTASSLTEFSHLAAINGNKDSARHIIFQPWSLRLTRKSTGGPPIRAMAVDSLRLFPPLNVPADLLTYLTSPSFWIPHWATFELKKANRLKIEELLPSTNSPQGKTFNPHGVLRSDVQEGRGTAAKTIGCPVPDKCSLGLGLLGRSSKNAARSLFARATFLRHTCGHFRLMFMQIGGPPGLNLDQKAPHNRPRQNFRAVQVAPSWIPFLRRGEEDQSPGAWSEGPRSPPASASFDLGRCTGPAVSEEHSEGAQDRPHHWA